MKSRKCHGLTVVLSGSMVFSGNGEEMTVGKGDILIQKCGDSYQLRAEAGSVEFIVISYISDSEAVVKDLLDMGRIFSGIHPTRYRDNFERAEEIYRNSAPWKQPLLRGMVQQMICTMLREKQVSVELELEDVAARAKRYMDEYACNTVAIEDVADAVGCSASYLRQIFKRNYGIPPVKYMNEVRIRRAKEMLASGFFTQEEISDACGFRNVYYFGRVFKELTGVSPGQY